MPYAPRKSRTKAGGYDIVNTQTGKKVGRSDSKAKAQKSADIRNRGHKKP
jgi:hypothetical protein